MSNPILKVQNLHKSFKEGKGTLEVLKDVNIDIHPGEIVALVGASGAGKSTLLHICGLLETPTTGSVTLKGVETTTQSERTRTKMRLEDIGFVYQFHHLLPEFTALENVSMPQLIAGKSQKNADAHAKDLIARIGLSNRITHLPSEMSGGEQQRIAIARAMANNPKLLLADEPTGNLDSKTADMVFAELVDFIRKDNIGALIATHNPDLAQRMDRVITVVDGKIEGS